MHNNIYKITFLCNLDNQVKFIDYSYKKEYVNYLKLIYPEVNKDIPLNEKFLYNSLHRMIFVTFNLKEFRDKIKSYGYSISGGPQSGRGEVNTMNNLLSLIDLEFRDSLYKNYCYHKNNEDGRYSFNYTLKRSHFNFQNIHCRLGGVRYTHNISNRNKDKLTSNTMDCKTNYLSLMKKFKHIINKFLNSIKYYNNLIN